MPQRKKKKQINVIVEPGATAGYLLTMLRDTFNGVADVNAINCKDVTDNNILKKTDILFIPGVQKASQAYREGLGIDGGNKIRDWVKKGGIVVGLCQGGYLLTDKFEYKDKYSGETRKLDSVCGIFEGTAYGPIDEFTNFHETQNPFIDHHVAKLAFNDASKGAACYAHGPYLALSPDADPAEYEIIARYEGVKDTPVAMAKRTFGKGKAIFSGVVPEIKGDAMASTDIRLIPKNTPNGIHLRTGVKFAQKLHAHESERAHVWQKLMNEIS